jgi:hypothetical protein
MHEGITMYQRISLTNIWLKRTMGLKRSGTFLREKIGNPSYSKVPEKVTICLEKLKGFKRKRNRVQGEHFSSGMRQVFILQPFTPEHFSNR